MVQALRTGVNGLPDPFQNRIETSLLNFAFSDCSDSLQAMETPTKYVGTPYTTPKHARKGKLVRPAAP